MKKIFKLMLTAVAVVTVLTALPVSVFAEEVPPQENQTQEVQPRYRIMPLGGTRSVTLPLDYNNSTGFICKFTVNGTYQVDSNNNKIGLDVTSITMGIDDYPMQSLGYVEGTLNRWTADIRSNNIVINAYVSIREYVGGSLVASYSKEIQFTY